MLHEKVKAVEVRNPHHVCFVMQAPWPDFLTVYSALVAGRGGSCPMRTPSRWARQAFNSVLDANDV